METKVKYNNISQELKDKIKAAAPKKGQVIYFEVAERFKTKRPNGATQYPTSVRVPPEDVIKDPYTEEYINIAYVTNPARNEFGEILFEGAEGGRIPITDDARSMLLFQYLFLSNYNQENTGKDYHVRPQNYLFQQCKPAITAKQKNDFKRQVRDAQKAIDEFPDSLLISYAVGLSLKNIGPHTDPEEIREQLFDLAEKKPQTILLFDKDYDKKFDIYVKRLIEKGILESSNAKWLWGDSQETIITFKVGTNKNDALKEHLAHNPEVKEMLDLKLDGTVAV